MGDIIAGLEGGLVTISRTKYIADISAFILADVSDNEPGEFRDGNPEFVALARVREFKNREGVRIYDNVRARTRDGRTNGNQISFESYDYETRKMRRKAEVLQYKKNINTQADDYKFLISKNGLSQAQLRRLQLAQTIASCKVVKGSCSDILYDESIPFEDGL
jgi:hypothetical protein